MGSLPGGDPQGNRPIFVLSLIMHPRALHGQNEKKESDYCSSYCFLKNIFMNINAFKKHYSSIHYFLKDVSSYSIRLKLSCGLLR